MRVRPPSIWSRSAELVVGEDSNPEEAVRELGGPQIVESFLCAMHQMFIS
jgi:hypothetical protein